MEFGRVISHNIVISPTSNKGFIVDVGCGRFAFSDAEDLIQALEEYLGDPGNVEKEYTKSSGAKVATRSQDTECLPTAPGPPPHDERTDPA